MIVSKYHVGLKTLLLQGLSEPDIVATWCTYYFKKIIVRYKKVGYNIDVLRQTSCLVVGNPKG